MNARPSTDSIWTHLSTDLRQFIRRRVAGSDAVDDLLQETFMRIHRNLGTLQDADHLAAWVYQIARNVIHDHNRKGRNNIVPLQDFDPAEDRDGNQSQMRCGGAGWMDEMVASLPEGYREAVQLAEIDGLKQQEVAHQLGITLSGAKSRVQRGRALLSEVLGECCTFQFDHAGRLVDCDPRPKQKLCKTCDES